jgi:Mrp family chromosome partitioning ATPase
MEKIQAAIAKARAQREVAQALQGQPGPVTPPGAAPVATAAAATVPVADAAPQAVLQAGPQAAPQPAPQGPAAPDPGRLWQALPEIRLKPRQLRRERILTLEGGPAATPFAVMRTRLLQQARQNGWRRIAITSPGPGCGKTFLSLNLAFSLGRQPDERTILFEMDFRRPSMARTLGQKEPQDLAAVLEGRAEARDNMLRHGANLAIATNRGKLGHAAEMLQSQRAARVLETIATDYAPTLMLFDMPPMMAGDDTMAFMGRVDAVLLTVAAETTTIRQIDQCERELATQTNIMGVVVNKCRYMEKDTAYGYYD